MFDVRESTCIYKYTHKIILLFKSFFFSFVFIPFLLLLLHGYLIHFHVCELKTKCSDRSANARPKQKMYIVTWMGMKEKKSHGIWLNHAQLIFIWTRHRHYFFVPYFYMRRPILYTVVVSYTYMYVVCMNDCAMNNIMHMGGGYWVPTIYL